MREEGLVEGRQRRAGGPVQFLVALPQVMEGVVVEAEPDMDAVFLDALVVGGIASAGPLAAETPALLVQGDLVTLCQLGSLVRRKAVVTADTPPPKMAILRTEGTASMPIAPKCANCCTSGRKPDDG